LHKVRLLAPNAVAVKKKYRSVPIIVIMEQYFVILVLVADRKNQPVQVVAVLGILQELCKTDVRTVME
jgi:hypothetical protein